MKQIEQPAALAEQEPVAWWHRKSNTFTSGNLVSNFAEWTPLYTAPQPAKQPLTREELFELAEPFGEFQYGDAQGHKRIDFANAIIAAYERINVYAAPQPRRNVTYVCPVCAASLERQE